MRRKISVMVADDDEVYARRFGEFVAEERIWSLRVTRLTVRKRQSFSRW